MKENKLKAKWNKRENDIIFYYPTKGDGFYLSSVFTKEFRNHLENRGYDITTLKFEITLRN